ncbi:MAG: tryptophan synthase subunit alpha [Elusimicrobia bacterium]|nr:tryptophan synthase subunit alpha [Elusimicrobiota bacterium]
MSRNRLEERFDSLKRDARKALIAYVTGGYPSLKEMDRTVRVLEKAGVDVVEIGVPFSDPIADGPTIQFASQKALENGITLKAILKWVATFRRSSRLPVVLMSYLNPIHRMGYRAFAEQASAAGVDGLIVPDLIPEEAGPLQEVLAGHGLNVIFLVAPTTVPERRKWVARRSGGFLYAVSLTGVTGVRQGLPKEALSFVKGLKKISPVPVAVGFGISKPDQVRLFAPHVDGVIFGSALVEKLKNHHPIYPFVKSLRSALDGSKS